MAATTDPELRDALREKVEESFNQRESTRKNMLAAKYAQKLGRIVEFRGGDPLTTYDMAIARGAHPLEAYTFVVIVATAWPLFAASTLTHDAFPLPQSSNDLASRLIDQGTWGGHLATLIAEAFAASCAADGVTIPEAFQIYGPSSGRFPSVFWDTIRSELANIGAIIANQIAKLAGELKQDLSGWFSTSSAAALMAITNAITRSSRFDRNPVSGFPTALVSEHGVVGSIEMRPNHIPDSLTTEEYGALVEKMWDHQRGLSDLQADVLMILMHRSWRHGGGSVYMTIDDLISARGKKKKLDGHGGRGGHQENIRREHLRSLSSLMHFYARLEAPHPTKRKTVITYESPLIVWRGREAEYELFNDATGRTVAFRYELGEVLATLANDGGYLAMWLPEKLLSLDYEKQILERRIGRYLGWMWRINAKHGDPVRPFKVRTLLEKTGHSIPDAEGNVPEGATKINPLYGSRFRERFERALDTLQQIGLLAAWQYDPATWEESEATHRGWFTDKWLPASIVIEMPAELTRRYGQIPERSQIHSREGKKGKRATFQKPDRAPSEPSDLLADRVRTAMKVQGIPSVLRAAELIGIPQPTLHRIMTGKGARSATMEKVEAWLSTVLPAQESE